MPNQLTKSTREDVFESEGDECVFCGVTREQHREDKGRDLDVHHVIPKRYKGTNDVENLIPVCISCHKTLESTQAKALKRIANEELNIDTLREQYSDCSRELEKQREVTSNVLNAFDELSRMTLDETIYIVHESKIQTSRLLYVGTSIKEAEKRFEDADGQVTMETANISIEMWVEIISEEDIERVSETSNVLADRIKDLQLD